MTDLPTLEREWDEAALTSPFFNILTIHDLPEPEFWQTGAREIDEVVDRLGPVRRMRALDFGCGIGRVTQALAHHYRHVIGVDVSSEMVRLAERHNAFAHVDYLHNTSPTLPFDAGTFDLVYSMIVLQHMPSSLAGGYVREFLRVTQPGGHVVFQIPEGCDAGIGCLRMYGTPRETVESWLAGHELVEVRDDDRSGAGYRSHQYTVRA